MPYKDKNVRKKYLRDYLQKNKEQRRDTARRYTKRLRRCVIDKYGGCCSKCRFKDVRALQIDHVNGGGTQERKTVSNKMLLQRLKREPIDNSYQILCANCNSIKRIVNKE